VPAGIFFLTIPATPDPGSAAREWPGSRRPRSRPIPRQRGQRDNAHVLKWTL